MSELLKKILVIVFLANLITILVILVFRAVAPFGAVVKYTYTLEKLSPLKPIEEGVFLIKEGENVLQLPVFVMEKEKTFFNIKLPVK